MIIIDNINKDFNEFKELLIEISCNSKDLILLSYVL